MDSFKSADSLLCNALENIENSFPQDKLIKASVISEEQTSQTGDAEMQC
jgi:hypothetical protein